MIFQFSVPEIEVGKCTTPHCFVMDELAVRGRAFRASNSKYSYRYRNIERNEESKLYVNSNKQDVFVDSEPNIVSFHQYYKEK